MICSICLTAINDLLYLPNSNQWLSVNIELSSEGKNREKGRTEGREEQRENTVLSREKGRTGQDTPSLWVRQREYVWPWRGIQLFMSQTLSALGDIENIPKHSCPQTLSATVYKLEHKDPFPLSHLLSFNIKILSASLSPLVSLKNVTYRKGFC